MDQETRAVRAALRCTEGNRCSQLYFPPNTPSQAGWSVTLQQQITIDRSAGSYGLTLDVWDDFAGATAGYRYARILIDNTVVWARDIAGTDSTSIAVSSTALANAFAGKSSAMIKLQMYDAQGVSSFHSTVSFDNLRPTGFTLPDAGFEDASSWVGSRSSSAYLYGDPKNIAPVVMIYAAHLSSENDVPTPAYVGAATQTALHLASQGEAEGAMTYALNLSGTDVAGDSNAACYDTVASLYAVH